jgi:hypothetical protein
MLAAVDADRTTNNSRMLIAFLGLIVLCLIAYGAVRAFGRFE